MNPNTRKALTEFIDAICELTVAVETVANDNATQGIYEASAKLKDALEGDETII